MAPLVTVLAVLAAIAASSLQVQGALCSCGAGDLSPD